MGEKCLNWKKNQRDQQHDVVHAIHRSPRCCLVGYMAGGTSNTQINPSRLLGLRVTLAAISAAHANTRITRTSLVPILTSATRDQSSHLGSVVITRGCDWPFARDVARPNHVSPSRADRPCRCACLNIRSPTINLANISSKPGQHQFNKRFNWKQSQCDQ